MICMMPHRRVQPSMGFLLKNSEEMFLIPGQKVRRKAIPKRSPTSLPEELPAAELHLLLSRMKIGDISAWDRFVDVEQKALWKYLVSAFDCFSDDEIEDIMQEVFLKVYNKGIYYRGSSEGEAKAWLHRIARNVAIDLIRDRERRPAPLIEDIPSDENIEDSIYELDRFFYGLTIREVEVLRLILDGYKEAEVAEKLGIARPRVSQLMKSIRKKVLRIINE